ncbi:MAG TPA: biotin carboxylase N-terminal domain-containing protein [Acidimicrobiia bacterium]|nr:biotin carboxylase N-terminal domain-containing protein [Acidimicrobiia bacterium]
MGEVGHKALRAVLIANRGEIAVRVIRACREAGLRSVACYADPDEGAPHTRLADEAHRLPGSTPGETYLNSDALLAVAVASGADAVHPGYGFLSENAAFAEAVLDAGLTWIGPPPGAMRALGDKVSAREVARRVGAPMAPGTDRPVADATEVEKFADDHGLPIAIKAAMGGGGRGIKIVHRRDDIAELFASAVREAEVAFGRGECFVERYLARARHVEAQVLADRHGTVVVVGTRDCSLQRRHQKLVEEAPAPFLSEEQRCQIHESAAAICREVRYESAGTVEYLVGEDGTVSFLEVNTRLQVEHPVTEETTGLDLVAQQFRIAAGERLDLPEEPAALGHSIEFRLNAEDPARRFLPAPGTVTRFDVPSGPGIRMDSGVEAGSVIGGQFDSLLAKLIVTGRDRDHALARARRALAELRIDGVPTVVPFHRQVVEHPDFVGDGKTFAVHTRWIDDEFLPAAEADPGRADDGTDDGALPTSVTVMIGGRPHVVAVPGLPLLQGASAEYVLAGIRERAAAVAADRSAVAGPAVVSPMQGTIVRVAVEEGRTVAAGDLIAVVEAMKMENAVTAHRDGVVQDLAVKPGVTVAQDAPICAIVAGDERAS